MPSAVISTYYYEKDSESLVVKYVSGIIYRYKLVPEDVYNQMKQSISKGYFLNKHIKGKYDFEKISN